MCIEIYNECDKWKIENLRFEIPWFSDMMSPGWLNNVWDVKLLSIEA
jgi:hypothetical protein